MIEDADHLDAFGSFGDGDGRAAKRLEPGDGRPLEPFRWWHLFTSRKLFFLRLPSPSEVATYAVDVRLSGKHAGDEGKAHLFRDGRHVAASRLPAVFPVGAGRIEVRLSTFGLRRMHYVTASEERQLAPHPASAVGLRLRLDRSHPIVSRWIAVASVVLLLAGVGLNIPQLLEAFTQLPPIAESFGTFHSPIRLPVWLSVALGIGAGVASMERGLRMRYSVLLDGLGN